MRLLTIALLTLALVACGSKNTHAGASAHGGAGADGSTPELPDAGQDVDAAWAPLTTTATATCKHATAPAGFDPVLIAAFSVDKYSFTLAALSAKGEALSLSCPDQTPDEQLNLSSDHRKVLFYTNKGAQNYTTSWLLDGVFELPTTIDGLDITTGYAWINDELLRADGYRRSATGDVVDQGIVVVRWDGTDARRLPGKVKIDNSMSAMAFLGATHAYGVYRLDASDTEPGFEYYRVNFADWSSKQLLSGLGGSWVSIWDPFNAATGRFLIAGDGHGIDALYAVDATTGKATSLNAVVLATTAQVSPDGKYAAWPSTSTYESQALEPSSNTRFTYDAINYHAQLGFAPGGHMFGAITDSHELVVVDPATGKLSMAKHAAAEAGAPGVTSFALTADGTGVFFTAALSASGSSAFFYAPTTDMATQLSSVGAMTSFDSTKSGANHAVFSDGQALYLASQTGPALEIPATKGSTRGWSLGWSRADKRMLVQTNIQGVDGLLLWTLGETSATSLRNAANASLGTMSSWNWSLLQH